MTKHSLPAVAGMTDDEGIVFSEISALRIRVIRNAMAKFVAFNQDFQAGTLEETFNREC